MKENLISDAIELIKSEDPVLYRKAFAELNNYENKSSDTSDFNKSFEPNIFNQVPIFHPDPWINKRNPFTDTIDNIKRLYSLYNFVRRVLEILSSKNEKLTLEDIIMYMRKQK